MEVDVEKAKNETHVRLSGELSGNQSTGFSERLLQLCGNDVGSKVVLDLSSCTRIDSIGYGALVNFRLAETILDKAVYLKKPSKTIAEQLALLNLNHLFVIQSEGTDVV